MGPFFEILFNRDKAKKAISDTKRDMLGMLKDVDKEAKKVAKSVSSVLSGMAGQRKFSRNLKGDSFNQFTASRDSNARRMLNEAIAMKMLTLDDFRGQANRKNLMNAIKSGKFKNDLNEWKKTMNEQQPVLDKQKKAVEKLTQANDKLERSQRRLNLSFGGGGGSRGRGTSWGGFSNLGGGWLSRMRYQLLTLITGGASIYGGISLGKSIFNAGDDDERRLFRMSVPFGNKGNAAAAMAMANQMSAGGSPFRRNDMLDAFQAMMEGGVDPRKKKNYNLYGNIAGTSGKSMTEVANDLNAAFYGDSQGLRKYGFSNSQIFRLDRMVNQRPDNRKNYILGILQGDKRYQNGMRDFAYSWKGMTNQLTSHWDMFKKSIIGSPTDKDSLFSAVKNVTQKIINWLQKNHQRIQRFGMMIGQVFKWIVQKVEGLMRRLAGAAERILKKTDGTNQQFKEKTARLILWLEAAKEKVVRFFDKWGWAIKLFVKLWIGYKLIKLLSAPFVAMFSAGKKVLSMFGLLRSGAGSIGQVFTGLLGKITLIGTAIAGIYMGMKKNQQELNKLIIDPNKKKTVAGAALTGVDGIVENTARFMYIVGRRGGHIKDDKMRRLVDSYAKGMTIMGPNGKPLVDPLSIAETAVRNQMQPLGRTADMLYNNVKSTLSADGTMPRGGFDASLKKFFGWDQGTADEMKRRILQVEGSTPEKTLDKRLKMFDDLLNERMKEQLTIIMDNVTIKADDPEALYKRLQEFSSQSGNQ